MELEEFNKFSKLFDCYKNCLSKEQFLVLSSFLEQGYDQSEIAINNSKSKQAVNKNFKVALKKLQELEVKIGFLEFKEKLNNSICKLTNLTKDDKKINLEIKKLKEL